MLISLAVILLVLILIICGDRGSKSIITTVGNGLVLLFAVYLIYKGIPPMTVTAGACVLVACIILFYQNELNIKSKIAFISVIIVLVILIPFVYYLASGSNAQGFNSEQYEITDTNGYTRNIGMDMLSLQISVMIIALIGTVIDISIAIATSVYEIRQNNAEITETALLKSAFTVSKSILSTSMHTIFYIYIAEYMTLIIQYVDEYSLVKLINSQSFCSEFISISVSGIGCCLIVPVTTILSTKLIHGKSLSPSDSSTIEL